MNEATVAMMMSRKTSPLILPYQTSTVQATPHPRVRRKRRPPARWITRSPQRLPRRVAGVASNVIEPAFGLHARPMHEAIKVRARKPEQPRGFRDVVARHQEGLLDALLRGLDHRFAIGLQHPHRLHSSHVPHGISRLNAQIRTQRRLSEGLAWVAR